VSLHMAYRIRDIILNAREPAKLLFTELPKPREPTQKEEDTKLESLGLPEPRLVYQEKKEGYRSWDDCANAGIEMDFGTVMHPLVTGDCLEAIFINMDSHVLKSHKSRIKTITEEQIKLADRKYIASVYFHTLFLYATSKSKNYSMKQGETEKDITDYLREIFAGSYSEFLLNFGTEQLMASLEL
jgi:hypothetical protein